MIETTDESIIKFNKDSFLLSFKDSGYQLLVKKWLRVVQLYSRKHLTKRKDKLVAISAIALWHSRALREHEYAAGVWIHEYSTIGLSHVEMLYQLYWKASLAVQREQEYVAPSWSWACMNGGITFPDHSMNGEPLARVFSVETELTSAKNYFGQVKSGLLRLNGVLKTMQDVLSHKVGRIDFEPLSHGEEKQLALAQTSGISMYLDCHPGLDPTISVSTVEATKGCYILILLEEALEGHFGFRSGFIGLILRETKDLRVVPVSYHSEPLYERVGLIDITHTWGDESAFQERQEQINFWSEFEATHVDGRVRYRLRPDETRYRTVALV